MFCSFWYHVCQVYVILITDAMAGPLDANSISLIDLPNDSFAERNFLDEIDPDLNLLSDAYGGSSYFLSHDFNQLVSDSPAFRTGFSAFHLNIRSAPANMGALSAFLSTLDFSFSVVGLTETWLNDFNTSAYSLPGYSSIGVHREHRRGGGVMILLADTIAFKRRTDLDLLADHCECVFAEISEMKQFSVPNHTKKVIIGCLYRPPNTDFDRFIQFVQSLLLKVKQERKTCYLLGDFNIHMNETANSPQAQQFMDLLHSHLFLPLIDKPSRITPGNSSLIDNIFTNSLCSNRMSGLFYTDISDHLPIFFLTAPESLQQESPIARRNFSERNKEHFTTMLLDQNWEDVLCCTTVNDCLEAFYARLNSLFENSFPLSTRPQKRKTNEKPWITAELKRLIRRKNKLYLVFHKRPTLFNEIRYKSLKRVVRCALRRAEKEYYHDQIQANRNNIKKTWEILNGLLGRGKRKPQVAELNVGDRTITNSDEIIEELNLHFATVGKKVVDEIPSSTLDSQSFLRDTNQESLFFTPVTEAEVYVCMSKLKSSSSGPDGIQPQLVKENCRSLVKPIVHLLNLSLTQGTVPKALKRAHVTPIHKGGDTDSLNNYRPISVLNVFSKIMERVVYNRLLSFLNIHSVLSNSQFGFRKKHSCELALISATEFIRHSLDMGSHVIAVYLDLKKAFDVVSHSLLFQKLEHYGVRGIPLMWFKSYLSDREQSVKLGNTLSGPQILTHGVPQGSVLGPLLFLLYVNDLVLSCNPDEGKLVLFADDTTLLIRNSDPAKLIESVNRELGAFSQWFRANKLSVNLSKTHYMVFTLNRRLPPFRPISMDGMPLDEVTSTKFLGVVIDNRLAWDSHIAYIAPKISKSIGVIRKVGALLPKNTRVQLYKSLILPYFTYSLLVWGGAGRTILERPIKLQKKALRAISLAPYRAHTEPLLRECNVLPFASLFSYQCAIFLFKYFHNLLPPAFCIDFELSHVHSQSLQTRGQSGSMLHIPRFRTTIGQKSFKYHCVKLYNEFLLPLDLHDIPTLNNLKRALLYLLS